MPNLRVANISQEYDNRGRLVYCKWHNDNLILRPITKALGKEDLKTIIKLHAPVRCFVLS